MDRHPNRLIDQLQSVHVRQQKVIQQLQAENARLLSDLAELRQERDGFRAEVAKSRKENSELQNRLDEAVTEYHDLKRERAALLRSVSVASVSTSGRASKLGSKVGNTLSVLDEVQTESPPTETTSTNEKTERATSPKSRPYLFRELPDPSGLKSELAQSENQIAGLGTVCGNSGNTLPGDPSPYTLHLNL